MTSKSKDLIKAFFETGDRPTESQFIDLIDSYVDKSGPIGQIETAASANSQGFAFCSAGAGEVINAAAGRTFLGMTVYTTALSSAVVMEATRSIYTTTAYASSQSSDIANALISDTSAANITYTASVSGMSGTNVQTIIDEVLDDWTAYTPTVAAQTGTITSASATGRYKRFGKTIVAQMTVTITTAGTGADSLIVGLPQKALPGTAYVGTSYESQSTGKSGAAIILSGSGNITLSTRDATGTTFIANGRVVSITITYEEE